MTTHPRVLEGLLNAYASQLDMAAYDGFMRFGYDELLAVARDKWGDAVPENLQRSPTAKAELVAWIMEQTAP